MNTWKISFIRVARGLSTLIFFCLEGYRVIIALTSFRHRRFQLLDRGLSKQLTLEVQLSLLFFSPERRYSFRQTGARPPKRNEDTG